MGTMEAEHQHVYKVRMGSFPCAWSPEGADAMARVRSWLLSGFGLPRGTREGPLSEARGARGDGRLGRLVSSLPGSRVRSEGKGREYPLAGSVAAWAPTSGSGRPAEASRVVRQHQLNADRGGSSG